MEAFDGAKSVLCARREKQRDTSIGNFRNEADGFIWPTPVFWQRLVFHASWTAS